MVFLIQLFLVRDEQFFSSKSACIIWFSNNELIIARVVSLKVENLNLKYLVASQVFVLLNFYFKWLLIEYVK